MWAYDYKTNKISLLKQDYKILSQVNMDLFLTNEVQITETEDFMIYKWEKLQFQG